MWKSLLKKNFRDLNDLLSFLEIDNNNKKQILLNSPFELNISYRFALKIKKNDLCDPLFRQFIPTIYETKLKKGFCQEPVEDSSFKKNNLIKKYSNRALLLCSDRCAMNCRFCFRQNLKFEVGDFSFEREIEDLKKEKNISELILSGGDPLMLDNTTIKALLQKIDKIPHIKRIRFHTRLLTALPERVDNGLIDLLRQTSKQIIFVLHINHPSELDDTVFESIKKIQTLNIPFLSQTVLLKKINDNPYTLLELFESLSSHGIIPYYLHQLDKVQSAAHFETPVSQGKKIIKKLRELTSGYNIPTYVQEIPFEKSKTPIQISR